MFHCCAAFVHKVFSRHQKTVFMLLLVLFAVMVFLESRKNTHRNLRKLKKKNQKISVKEDEEIVNSSHKRTHITDLGIPGTNAMKDLSRHDLSHFHPKSSPEEAIENSTRETIPKNWLPSWSQKHLLHLHKPLHPLDFEHSDVLVFLHIPKTSGKTFNAHLADNMKVPRRIACDCKTLDKPHGCKCLNSGGYIWLFSRLSTAWPCGVHPSWSDLTTECLNHAMDRKEGKSRKRRFTIITMLRDPYTRYISEWHQIKEAGQWKPFHKLRCFPLTREQYCYDDDWRNVTLNQFLDCPSNPANNRQVRMLADLNDKIDCPEALDWLKTPNFTLDSVGISKRSKYIMDNPVLKSAMHNLNNLAFFGLEEYQRETEYLFTKTFGYSFKQHFNQSKTYLDEHSIHKEQRERVLDTNKLDIVFYKYAKELFFKRLHENTKRKHDLFQDDIEDMTHPPVE